MPLTSGSVTIKLAGGTYSTWAAFWDDLGNLTGNITCTVDASAFTEAAAPAALTETLGGYTLTVTAATFATKTDASDGPRFTCNYIGTVLEIGLEGAGAVLIEGMIIIEGTSEPAFGFRVANVNTAYSIVCRRNIVKGTAIGYAHGDGTVMDVEIYNNILYDASDENLRITFDLPDPAIVANNTLVNSGNDNVNAGDEEVDFENNLNYVAVDRCWANILTLTNGANNATSDTTGEDADWGGTGSNNLDSIANPFNNLGADDFSITAEGVIGRAGLDLSGDGITTDFFGVARHPTTPTIGACELPMVGGAMTTNTGYWGAPI